MKTLILDYDYEPTRAALRNPAFKKVWIPAVISCICAGRSPSMKYAPIFYGYDALWPPPFHSNAAWQHL